MRLASFVASGVQTYGTVKEEGVVDVGARTDVVDLKAAITRFTPNDWAQFNDLAVDYALDDISWLPVITDPDKILCVGINYVPHIKETGREPPEHPWLFVRFPNSLVGHGSPIVPTQRLTSVRLRRRTGGDYFQTCAPCATRKCVRLCCWIQLLQ